MSPRLRLLTIVVLALQLGACESAAPSASTTQATGPGPTTQAPSIPPSPASTPEAAPTPIDSGPHLSLVGLGDSVPGGLKCVNPCQSYVLTFGALAQAALGQTVVATNMATNDGLESDQLLERVTKRDEYRTAIAGADIVTLQVGGNDWQGPCNFENHLTCLPAGLSRVKPNVDGILAEIVKLRAGKPTAIRVVTYYNGYLGNKLTPSIWDFPARPDDIATLDRDFIAALADFNAMLCKLALAHHAICVEVGAAFNGPKLDQQAAPGLIDSDGAHALKAGQDLIAKLLDEAGYAPLK